MKVVGMKAYYKGFFGSMKECTVVDVEKIQCVDFLDTGVFLHNIYRYTVEFPNGKRKTVNSNKLI